MIYWRIRPANIDEDMTGVRTHLDKGGYEELYHLLAGLIETRQKACYSYLDV